MFDNSFAMHAAFSAILTPQKPTKNISMFALCFRVVDIGQDGGGGGGGLMGELVNLQMDQFSDICQEFNK